MTTDNQVSEQTHQYFLQEAAELLQTMDDELQDIREDFSVQKVHNLMRAAHTLKGASASVGLDGVKKTTHSLEDVFKALCHQDTVISIEMEGLIFQGYDCLKLLMSAQLAGAKVDEADILDRMASVVTQLQEMLGDRFGQGGHLPTSAELGFDMTQSIFEVGVTQRIETLEEALSDPDPEELIELLETQVEIFVGLAESLDLPGFAEVATTTLEALEKNPDKVLEIAPIALANYKEAQAAVLAGDRERGGKPSAALLQFCGKTSNSPASVEPTVPNKLIERPQQAVHRAIESRSTNDRVASNASEAAAKTGLFKRLWHFLTRPIGSNNDKTEKAEPEPEAPSLSAPSTLLDYAAEGEEPADLALADLAPSALSAMNLPNTTVSSSKALITSDTAAENDIEELADLAPLNLEALSQQPQAEQPNALTALPTAESSCIAEPAEPDLETPETPAQLATPPVIELPTAPVRSPSSNATIRMTVEDLDQLSQAMGELLTHQNRQALYNEQLAILVRKLLDRIARQQKQLNRQRGKSQLAPKESLSPLSATSSLSNLSFTHFDSLELDQYSDVQLLAQSFIEETVQQSESAEAIELFVRKAGQELEKQKRLLANTRETLLGSRMLPLDKIFQRFPVAIERLQAQHHKTVKLEIAGGDVLVDKVIADKLYDPLLHLVRNAFDHGIESPDARVEHNKSATGVITIEALQQGRHLVINVKDDGQGLNLNMIRRKAVENQIITAEEAENLNEAQTVDLLFEAGFSTAAEVDDLSGRGVGLDAVRAQVRSIQGWVAVTYEPGGGTCFTLQIPSSLTIAKLLLCQAKGRIYALIADAVEHILIPKPEQVRAWDGGKTLTWQANGEEHLVPISALSEVLHYASPMPNHRLVEASGDIKSATSEPVIVLKHQKALVGIEVDQLLGEQELVISSLGETVVPPPYLYGSSILPDGQLTLVLDGIMLAKIILEQRNRKGNISVELDSPSQITSTKNKPVFVKKLILTVDDSITVRNALAEALQKADYQVIQARDGAEALQQLKRYPGVEAILCDIEMPGMNGFEFLKVRQQTPSIAAIPTIMLTSRAGTKHRLLTKELGATTYLTKPYLTPQLLKTVSEAIESTTNTPSEALSDAKFSTVGDSHHE